MDTVLLIPVAFIAGYLLCYYRASAYRRFIVLEILGDSLPLAVREIRKRFKDRTGVSLALATLYADLSWLEERGWVYFWKSIGSGERGGFSQRIYRRTGKALNAA